MQVGITVQNVNHPSYDEFGYYLNIRWKKFAEEVGFTLIPIISIGMAKQMISDKYINAIILSGGGNLSEKFLTEIDEKQYLNNVDLEREQIEKVLIEFSIKTNTPLIGICRGMQAIAMYFGGKLSTVDKHVNTRHVLEYFCPVLNCNVNRNVNSYHNYSLDKKSLPKYFQINTQYMSSIEQMIHEKKKILGIMWHPEREEKFSKLDIKLFRNFLNL